MHLYPVIQDGSGIFEIGHVPPGRYIVEATALNTGQNLSAHRAIEVGNTDREGIQLTLAPPQNITGMFVFPDGSTLEPQDPEYRRDGQMIQTKPDGSFRIGGTVLANVKDADGKPRPNCYVQLLPDPPRRKQRALRSYCTTDATGTCTIAGIARGPYRIFSGFDLRRPDELADVDDSGKPFTIEEGEKQQIDLKLVPDDKPI